MRIWVLAAELGLSLILSLEQRLRWWLLPVLSGTLCPAPAEAVPATAAASVIWLVSPLLESQPV